MITSYNTLLPIDNPHADAIDTGMAIKPIPVRDNVMEVDVVAKLQMYQMILVL